jgi:hypothetical protein
MMDPSRPESSGSSHEAASDLSRRRAQPVWLPLLLILIVAVGVRVTGLYWGLPDATHVFSYHPDEYHSLRGAFSLALGGDPNPHFFNYGSLYLYLVAAAVMLADSPVPQVLTHEAMGQMLHDWTVAARHVNLLLAALTVLVIYLAGRELLSQRFGLLAALVGALCPLHVLHSHYATVDVPQAFFIALTLLFAVRIGKTARTRDYLYAGLCAGLAASVKYNGALVLIAPLVAHCMAAPGQRRVGLLSWQPLAMLALAAAAFTLTSPYTFLDWAHARQDIVFELNHMRLGEEPARSADPSGWLFHGLGLTLTTGGATVAALVGLVALWASRFRREATGVIVFGLLWFVMIALAQVRYGRYEVALTPVLALLVAAGPAALSRRRVGWRLLAALLPVITLGLSLGTSALMVQRLQQEPDPRDVALGAILRNVPPGRAVGLAWDPWFNAPPVDPLNGGQVLRQNPLWRQFSKPLRPLVITGLDATALQTARPFAFALSNFEIRDALRLGQPGAVAFQQVLHDEYLPAAIITREAPLSGILGWAPPQDWLYAFPEATVYILKKPRVAPLPTVPAAGSPSPRP